jgi:hypothetical protein
MDAGVRTDEVDNPVTELTQCQAQSVELGLVERAEDVVHDLVASCRRLRKNLAALGGEIDVPGSPVVGISGALDQTVAFQPVDEFGDRSGCNVEDGGNLALVGGPAVADESDHLGPRHRQAVLSEAGINQASHSLHTGEQQLRDDGRLNGGRDIAGLGGHASTVPSS